MSAKVGQHKTKHSPCVLDMLWPNETSENLRINAHFLALLRKSRGFLLVVCLCVKKTFFFFSFLLVVCM